MAKELVIFYMEGCPYCRAARRAVEQLKKEKSEYAQAWITWIDEQKDTKTAESYDYYYVPSVFSGKEKLYEAHPSDSDEKIYSHLKECLEYAMK